jgi:hypothetical protein
MIQRIDEKIDQIGMEKIGSIIAKNSGVKVSELVLEILS